MLLASVFVIIIIIYNFSVLLQVIILVGLEHGHLAQVPNTTSPLPFRLLLPRKDGHLKPPIKKMTTRLVSDHKEGQLKKTLRLLIMAQSLPPLRK